MRIIHVLRKPLGGLFRHVYDLANEQASIGHDVGIICDQTDCGADSQRRLKKLAETCNLGVERIPIRNFPGFSDFQAHSKVKSFAAKNNADILHGHGAKGGLFARLASKSLGLPSAYTPHGGALHYSWTSPAGIAFLTAEKLLRVKKSGLIFVCEFERRLFDQKIGLRKLPNCVAYNGLTPEEFKTVTPNSDASHLLFVGEMRYIKGVDVLLEAIANLRSKQNSSATLVRDVTATLVGDGPDINAFKLLAEKLGISNQVSFVGRKTMNEAQKLGYALVVPSRNESFPYVVLEAIAAQIPVIATDVGGISELIEKKKLCASGNVEALASAISYNFHFYDDVKFAAKELQITAGSRFSVKTMTNEVCILYNRLMTA